VPSINGGTCFRMSWDAVLRASFPLGSEEVQVEVNVQVQVIKNDYWD